MLEPRPRQTVPIQSVSRFFGITEPRPRQTVPIPCLLFYFSWNARTQASPDSPYSNQFHVSFFSTKNCSLSLCTSASQLMCEPCNVLQPGPRSDLQRERNFFLVVNQNSQFKSNHKSQVPHSLLLFTRSQVPTQTKLPLYPLRKPCRFCCCQPCRTPRLIPASW